MAPGVVIPPELSLTGRVECAADLIIEGSVEGEIEVGGALTVEGGGECRASVRAASAIVRGEILGNVTCSQKIEVASGARVVGDLRAPDISVDADAEVVGRIDLLAPAAVSAPVRTHPMSARGPGVRRPIPPAPPTEIDSEPAHEPS